jgi:hypothetical protein
MIRKNVLLPSKKPAGERIAIDELFHSRRVQVRSNRQRSGEGRASTDAISHASGIVTYPSRSVSVSLGLRMIDSCQAGGSERNGCDEKPRVSRQPLWGNCELKSA